MSLTILRALSRKPFNILLLITILIFSLSFHYYDYIKTLKLFPGRGRLWRDADENLLDLKDFKFLINQRKMCSDCDDNFLLMIAIISTAVNRLERNEVRLMWGEASKCIKMAFLMGTSNDASENDLMINENRRHGDIIQGNFAEYIFNSYKNSNSYKHMMVLKWTSMYCSNARFLVKIDEAFVLYLLDNDVILDLAKFRLFLKRVLMVQDGIACRVLRNGTFFKKNKNRTKTMSMSHGNMLPYCWGGLVVYPANVVNRILRVSQKLPPSGNDDVFVTGLLARRAGVRHLNFEPHFFLKTRDNDWLESLKALFAMKISAKDFFESVY